MTSNLSKADQQKINKLELVFDQLITGEEIRFPITKLLSIKSLCTTLVVRQQYCLYLYKILAERLIEKQEEQPVNDLQNLYILIKDVYRLRHEELSSPEVKKQLRTLSFQLGAYQSKTQRIKSTTVRLIKDSDLLTLEYLTDSLSRSEEEEGEYAQKITYYATRNYVECYNSSIGTGIITDSIPALEDVLVFWRQLSSNYDY